MPQTDLHPCVAIKPECLQLQTCGLHCVRLSKCAGLKELQKNRKTKWAEETFPGSIKEKVAQGASASLLVFS
eukprot:scaffold15205_cov18-Tisochrysis_lutea.AAC.3